jgi:hypothetical protein
MELNREIEHLLVMLDEAYSRAAWHGPNLRGSLRGIGAREAAWRPGKERHNIWEIVVHAAYWKYTVRRRLIGEKRGSFVLEGSNWFVRPPILSEKSVRPEKAWLADLSMLAAEHQRLKAAVAEFQPEYLDRPAKRSKTTARRLIVGIAFHDVYHAGQIQLIKRLMRTTRSS